MIGRFRCPASGRKLISAGFAFVILGWQARSTSSLPQQDEELNDSGLTCEQIVQLGQARFFKAYDKKHPQTGARKPYAIYNECKRKDNDARIAKLPADRRK